MYSVTPLTPSGPVGPHWGSMPYGSVFDQYPLADGCWTKPTTIVYRMYEVNRPVYGTRELIKRNGRYLMRERNSKETDIGILNVSEKRIVNIRPDGSFDCILCMLKLEGMTEPIQLQIPEKDIRNRRILPYLQQFKRNPDCPPWYVVEAFYAALLDGEEIKYLSLPEHSGWIQDGDRWLYQTAAGILPVLEQYYPADIRERKLPQTLTPVEVAAHALAKAIPHGWKWKLLLAFSVASLFLSVFRQLGFLPDRMLIVQPENEMAAKTAAVLLKNQSFADTTACALTECRTTLDWALDVIYDGVALFRDSSYKEDRRRREAGMDVLLRNLKRGLGINEVPPHLIAIISDQPGLYSSELPALYLNLRGCQASDRIKELQEKVGVFESALLKHLSESDSPFDYVKMAIAHTGLVIHVQRFSDRFQLESILKFAMTILKQYGLISDEEIESVKTFFCSEPAADLDSDLEIVNDFRQVLSDSILSDDKCIANQSGHPYYQDQKKMVMLDQECVNFTADYLNRRLHQLKTTRHRNNVLSSLKNSGKLRCNNNYKRLLDVEVSPGTVETLNFYSVPRSFLTPAAQRKLRFIRHSDRLFRRDSFPSGFQPLVLVNDSLVAGRVFSEETDEAESVFISGQTRSGKTFLLVQQAVIRAACGDRVIIFDQSGAFSQDEIRKHLPSELADLLCSHWDIGRDGLPINLLSLADCSTLPEKKERLAGIFASEGRITGEVQGKYLRKAASKIARAIEAGEVSSLSETLRFFDPNEPTQAEIRERLEEAFDDIEGLPLSLLEWDAFLASQKPVTIISTAADSLRKSSQHIDALLASLYGYKQHHRNERYTLILDEIEELDLDRDGAMSTILRKGGKHGLTMLLASQTFSAEQDRLGRLIGNCALQVFFHPKDADISAIAKHIGVERQQLAALEQHEFLVSGPLYERQRAKNTKTIMTGKAYSAADSLAPVEPPTEAQEIPDESPEQQSDDTLIQYAENMPESQDMSSLPPASPIPDETEPSTQEMQQSQPSETVNDEPEMESSESVESPAAEPTKAEPSESIPETEEQPAPSESDEPEPDPQELIEAELQQRFRELKRRFSPDHPTWSSDLAEFFEVFLGKHHFENPSERDSMQGRLHGFLYVSSDCFDYRNRLEALFKELWPDS